MSIHDDAEKAMWNDEGPVADNMKVPVWIESDISWQQVCAITNNGCKSGAYMPAVTYYKAQLTMGHYGDEVFDFLYNMIGDSEEVFDFLYNMIGEWPAIKNITWSLMCAHVLSKAVDLWAFGAYEHYVQAFKEFA